MACILTQLLAHTTYLMIQQIVVSGAMQIAITVCMTMEKELLINTNAYNAMIYTK
jgi:hypothetical protein